MLSRDSWSLFNLVLDSPGSWRIRRGMRRRAMRTRRRGRGRGRRRRRRRDARRILLAPLPTPWCLSPRTITYRTCHMPGFHHSVAVLPLPFRRSRYVNSVIQRLRYISKFICAVAVATCMPLCCNRRSVAIGSNPILPFCRSGHLIPMYT